MVCDFDDLFRNAICPYRGSNGSLNYVAIPFHIIKMEDQHTYLYQNAIEVVPQLNRAIKGTRIQLKGKTVKTD